MTEVAFHFNVPDKLNYACRLLRKARAAKAQVLVTADRSTLEKLDQLLWTFSALDFVPHCLAGADAALYAASPVVLADQIPDDLGHQQILLNLGSTVPAGFARFERLIEVVSTDDDDRSMARPRWKHYQDRGYTMTRHDQARIGQGS